MEKILEDNVIIGDLVDTKHGQVMIVEEEGKKKVNFKASKFKSIFEFIRFLKDEELTYKLLGY